MGAHHSSTTTPSTSAASLITDASYASIAAPVSTCANSCGGAAYLADAPPVPNGTTVGLAVLKLPRVGSTWLKAEMNLLPGARLEFEPLTDGKHRDAWCGADFTNEILRRMLVRPQECVNRKMIGDPCFWTKQSCDPSRIRPRQVRGGEGPLEISGFLLHPFYTPEASWPPLVLPPARARLVVLRRTNLIKRTISNILRVAEKAEENADLGSDGHGDDEESDGDGDGGADADGGRGGGGAPKLNRTVPPAEVAREVRRSLETFLALPQGLSLSSPSTFLLLYEDLQNSRVEALGRMLRWVGKPQLARQIAPRPPSTHWAKAPESLCDQLANCAAVRRALEGSQCFLAQLLSTSSDAWTLPATADGKPDGLRGGCARLPPLSADNCHRRRLPQLLPGSMGDKLQNGGQRHGCGAAQATTGKAATTVASTKARQTDEQHASPAATAEPLSCGGHDSTVGPDGLVGSTGDADDEKRGCHSFRRFTSRVSTSTPAQRAAAARAATRFVIFSRQRSASSTFVSALNLHPHVSCGFELFAPKNQFGDEVRKALGFGSHAEQLARLADFMEGWWSLCPSKACGFKVFTGQVHPLKNLPLLLGPVDGSAAATGPDAASPVRVILLERWNVSAEYASWMRAVSTGSWGTSPARQAAQQQGALRLPFHHANATATGAGSGGGKAAAHLYQQTEKQFKAEHDAWFKAVGDVVPKGSPTLHLFTEDLTAGADALAKTMARVFKFLSLPGVRGKLQLPARLVAPESSG